MAYSDWWQAIFKSVFHYAKRFSSNTVCPKSDQTIIFVYILQSQIKTKDDYFILKAYLDLWGVSGSRTEHDQHVIQSLQLDVVPQKSAEVADRLVELLLVEVRDRPWRGELLLVLQAHCSHPLQSLHVTS